MASSGGGGDALVTAEDQARINGFARLHARAEELSAERAGKARQLRDLSDAADELLLLDDADAAAVPLRVGESFVHFTADALADRFDADKARLEGEVGALDGQLDALQKDKDALKALLYAKFGSTINLEADDDNE